MLLLEVRHTRVIRNFLKDGHYSVRSLDFLLENNQLKKKPTKNSELCVPVANIFLFISSRIQSRFFSSPKNFILLKIFHGGKANQKHSALAPSSNTWGFSHSPDLGLGNTPASWQSWFTQVAQRHTSNQLNTRQANPLLMISNIDLLKLPFPRNSSNYLREILPGQDISPFPPPW